jgi:hypothetical protein
MVARSKTCNRSTQYVTELLRSNVLLCYHGNEINKPLHSNGHVLIDAHVGGSHIGITVA